MHSLVFVAIVLVAFCFPAVGQETRYTPQGGVSPSKGKVSTESVRLLAAQDLFDRNISVEKLAPFIQSVEKAVALSIPPDAAAFELVVQVTLSPSAKPKLDLSSNGKASDKLLQEIYDNLRRLQDVRSKTDLLPFQIHFVIKSMP